MDYLYVFWVFTGQENKAIKEIKSTFRDNEIVHLQMLVETFFRKQGKVKKETKIAFPGYVFILSEISNDEFIIRSRETIRKSNHVLKLLRYGNSCEAALRKEERMAIERLWQSEDCIAASTGIIAGDKVIVTDGPFKGRESVIKEIHPRRRQAIVEINFMGEIRSMAVGLEIVEKLP